MHQCKRRQFWGCSMPAIIFSIVFCNYSEAQHCKTDSGFWNDYKGKLAGQEIQLSYFTNYNGTISGNYRFIKNENRVYTLQGNQQSCNFFVRVHDHQNQNAGSFTFIKWPDSLSGHYKDAAGNTLAVHLLLHAMVGGSQAQRYGFLFGTTQQVDSFAAKIKTAFIANDKHWLAAHCWYPLKIYMENGKAVTVNNKQSFLAAYGKYFKQAYRDKFKKMKCYNMFSNHMGAAMGAGEVWMSHGPTAAADNYEYFITSITVL